MSDFFDKYEKPLFKPIEPYIPIEPIKPLETFNPSSSLNREYLDFQERMRRTDDDYGLMFIAP